MQEGNISIHALREEGDPLVMQGLQRLHKISIHALREEGDGVIVPVVPSVMISIHALREEGDGWAVPY